MTRDEATLGILGGILHSATRTSLRAAELQADVERLQAHLRAHGEEPATAAELASVLEAVRRLTILVQTHSSTVTSAEGVNIPGWRGRLRRLLRRATRGRSS